MISEILADIQSKMVVEKGRYSEFGEYAYRSADDILNAVRPLLAEHKAYITLTDSIVQVGGRYYVEATARLHAGGKSICTKAYAREQETKKKSDDAQVTGMSSTYARKYALCGLLAVSDGKDADSENNGPDDKEDRLIDAKNRLWRAIKSWCDGTNCDPKQVFAQAMGDAGDDVSHINEMAAFYEGNERQ